MNLSSIIFVQLQYSISSARAVSYYTYLHVIPHWKYPYLASSSQKLHTKRVRGTDNRVQVLREEYWANRWGWLTGWSGSSLQHARSWKTYLDCSRAFTSRWTRYHADGQMEKTTRSLSRLHWYCASYLSTIHCFHSDSLLGGNGVEKWDVDMEAALSLVYPYAQLCAVL